MTAFSCCIVRIPDGHRENTQRVHLHALSKVDLIDTLKGFLLLIVLVFCACDALSVNAGCFVRRLQFPYSAVGAIPTATRASASTRSNNSERSRRVDLHPHLIKVLRESLLIRWLLSDYYCSRK